MVLGTNLPIIFWSWLLWGVLTGMGCLYILIIDLNYIPHYILCFTYTCFAMCPFVLLFSSVSAALRIYILRFSSVSSGYVVHIFMKWFIIVWYSSSDLPYGVLTSVGFQFTIAYCYCIRWSCGLISAVYSMDMICTIVSVGTMPYIWYVICFHFQCVWFRYYLVCDSFYPINLSIYFLHICITARGMRLFHGSISNSCVPTMLVFHKIR